MRPSIHWNNATNVDHFPESVCQISRCEGREFGGADFCEFRIIILLGVIVAPNIEMDYRINKNVPCGSVGCGRNDKVDSSFNF